MRGRFQIALAIFVLGAQFFSCTDTELTGTQVANQRPSVWLSAAPPEGSTASYTIALFWGGWDPDGEISHYEYAITNNSSGVFDPADTTGADKWHTVASNDSTFLFSADELADSAGTDFDNLLPLEYERPHTFFVRSVDEQGLASIPAYRSFTSRTLSPTVDIIVPKTIGLTPASIPPIATFKWTARDFISNTREQQDPESVRWIIVPTSQFDGDMDRTIDYVRKHPNAPEWYDWIPYKSPDESGRAWTSFPLDVGQAYIFAVQVRDEAGAVNPVFDEQRNLRRVRASARKAGPILTVNNRYLGTLRTSTTTSSPAIIDLPAGLTMEFCFNADASGYGGIVAGYRYGWDILDLNDDSQWEISYTPFPGDKQPTITVCSRKRKFFFGSHTFHIEVVDNNGFKSRIGVTVNVIPFTMQRNLLLVDDWFEGTPQSTGWSVTRGAVPTDAEHDEFWRDMLSDVQGFDPSFDVIQIGGATGVAELPITKLANYRALIWSAQGSHTGVQRSFLYDVIKFNDPTRPVTSGKVFPNIVGLYMAAGGHVMLAGDQIMTMNINKQVNFPNKGIAYPLMFRYELGGDQDGRYTGEGNDVGKTGIGDNSFAYSDCCLNVLDVAYAASTVSVRRPPNQPAPEGCPVNTLRDHDGAKDGIRVCAPVDTKYNFPTLQLRPEAASTPDKFYHVSRLGLNGDVYNPIYFHNLTQCKGTAELVPRRSCFKPIYALHCRNPYSKIYNAPIAFWTTVYENRVPDVGGVAARSCVWGVHPVFFKPAQVKQAMDIILFNEWKLPRE